MQQVKNIAASVVITICLKYLVLYPFEFLVSPAMIVDHKVQPTVEKTQNSYA